MGGTQREGSRRDDVLAGLQQRGHLTPTGYDGCVDDGVGLQPQDLLGVGRGEYADRVDADDRTDVLAVLVGGVHPAADQLELRVLQDRLDRRPAYAAGGPLHDPDRGAHCPHVRGCTKMPSASTVRPCSSATKPTTNDLRPSVRSTHASARRGTPSRVARL